MPFASASPWLIVLAGSIVGILVGLMGTSGAFMIPTMVYVFGLTQLRAQGTSLFIALIPIWIFPLISYARAGNVQWRFGLWMALGLAAGSYFGGQWAQTLPDALLKRGFGLVLLGVAVRMLLTR